MRSFGTVTANYQPATTAMPPHTSLQLAPSSITQTFGMAHKIFNPTNPHLHILEQQHLLTHHQLQLPAQPTLGTAHLVPSNNQTTSASASTTLESATNHLALSDMSVNTVKNLVTPNSNASTQQVLHSDKFNPLPSHAITPVNILNFSKCTYNHPDQNLTKYLLEGLTHGFDIGFHNTHTPTNPNNLLSATEHCLPVTQALMKEVERGHTAGPFPVSPIPNLHCSPLGSREKKDGTRRLIMDLSQPRGFSVNEGIDKEEFTVKYTHFDEATNMVRKMGKHCLMSKIDIKHAFRLLPVKPAQWILLGICWLGQIFIDTRLPFGLRSSPGIFNKFADVVCWIIRNIFHVKNIVHYSDDFFLVSPNDIHTAQTELNTVKSAFRYINVPIAEDKLEGPSHLIPYLGILINSSDLTMEIPHDKASDITKLLLSWSSRKKCTKRELQSLIGKLSFICKVIRPGRLFLRRLIDLSTTVTRKHHHISLNKEAQADINWWIDNLSFLNRKSIIPDSMTITSDDLKLFTDASKTIGFGAFYNNSWIQAKWPPHMQDIDIDYKELFAILAACMTWGHTWKGHRIIFFTDNEPITQIWETGTTKSPKLMSLIRKLYLLAAQCEFTISFKHIPGTLNPIADALSRFQVTKFHQLAPNADQFPTEIPAQLWEI